MTEVAESIEKMSIDSENTAPPKTPHVIGAVGQANLGGKLQDKIVARMEKEKGRTLTKHEMTTTIKALMKYNSKKRKSMKKRGDKKKQKTAEGADSGGEGASDDDQSGEELDSDMDEEGLNNWMKGKSKTNASKILWFVRLCIAPISAAKFLALCALTKKDLTILFSNPPSELPVDVASFEFEAVHSAHQDNHRQRPRGLRAHCPQRPAAVG